MTELPKLLLHADALLHARWVLPMHEVGKVLEHQIIAITNGCIVDMGPRVEIGRASCRERVCLYV